MAEKIRNKLDTRGAAGLTDTDILDSLLSFIVVGRDTRKIATALIKKFGSFSTVLGAPESELLKITGIDIKTAKYLTQLPEFARYYLDDITNKTRKRIFDTNSSYDQFRLKFLGMTKECVAIIILNSRGQIVHNDILWQGTVSQVPVYIRELVSLCIHFDADTVIIAHNHPSGNPAPSRGDVSATKEIQIALDGIYVNLEDHLIITDTDYTSLRKSGWLSDVSAATSMYRNNILMSARKAEDELGLAEE